jgi:hypothetical protein
MIDSINVVLILENAGELLDSFLVIFDTHGFLLWIEISDSLAGGKG